MHLGKFVHTESGRMFMSLILGLGLATLFKISCKGKNCIVYNAPPIDEIKDKTYKIDNKCYTFESKPAKCNPNKQILNFA